MVNFSKNWNGKLSWGIIPTIRLFTIDKYLYYQGLKGELMPVTLNRTNYCEAYLWQVKNMLLKNIPDWLKRADTGLEPDKFDEFMQKMYSNKPEWKGLKNTRMIILVMVKNFEDDGGLDVAEAREVAMDVGVAELMGIPDHEPAPRVVEIQRQT